MIKVRKTFKVHLQEFLAVILIEIAEKVAPSSLKLVCKISLNSARRISQTDHIYIKELSNAKRNRNLLRP
jgi:hypothetical protein